MKARKQCPGNGTLNEFRCQLGSKQRNLVIALQLVSVVCAVAAPEDPIRFRVVESGAPGLSFEMPVKAGYSYYPQWSEDLTTWKYAGATVAVEDGTLAWSAPLNGNHVFLRMGSVAAVHALPDQADFDGDGFSDALEVQWGSNPLDPNCYPNTAGRHTSEGAIIYRIDGRIPVSTHYYKKTIQEAIDKAETGDLIVIGKGMYPENLLIDTKDIALIAVPGEQVILDGGKRLGHGIWVRNCSVRLGGIIVQRYKGNAVYGQNARITADRLIVQDSYRGIHLTGESLRVENSIIRRNVGLIAGLQVDWGQVRLLHCAVIDNQSIGAAATLYADSAFGATYKRATDLTVSHCIIWNAGTVLELDYNTGKPNIRVEVLNCRIRGHGEDTEAALRAHVAEGIVTGRRDFSPLGAVVGTVHYDSYPPGEVCLHNDYFGSLRHAGEGRDPGPFMRQRGPYTAMQDSDGDALPGFLEAIAGTNPHWYDSDADGMSDAFELSRGLNAGLTQFQLDADGDGYPNDYEIRWGTSITDPTQFPHDQGPSPLGSGCLYVVNPSTAEETEFRRRTIQSAVDSASSGDIIRIMAGTYPEQIRISGSDKSLLMRWDAGAILQGDGSGYGIYVENNNEFISSGGCIENFDVGVFSRDSRARFEQVEIRANRLAILARNHNAEGGRFINTYVHGNANSGPVVLIEGGYPEFIHCTFIDNRNIGVNDVAAIEIRILSGFSSRSADAQFINCLIWNPAFKDELACGPASSTSTATATLSGSLIRNLSAGATLTDGTAASPGPGSNSRKYPFLDHFGRPLPISPALQSTHVLPGITPVDFDGDWRDPHYPAIGAFEAVSIRPCPDELRGVMVELSPAGEYVEVSAPNNGSVHWIWDLTGEGDYHSGSRTQLLPTGNLPTSQLSYRSFGPRGWSREVGFTLADAMQLQRSIAAQDTGLLVYNF